MEKESGGQPSTLTPEQRDQFGTALRRAEVSFDCPMCENPHFVIMDRIVNIPLTAKPGSYDFTGPALPVAVIVCKRCGFVSQHALGILNLLPKGDQK